MASREGDTALWLHNKLGSTDDLWSGMTICSQLSQEKLQSIQTVFRNLQPLVKVKLLLSFLHLSRRNVEEWKTDLEEILELAVNDSDQWVSMIGDIMRVYPSTGALNLDIDEHIGSSFYTQIVTELKKTVKKSGDIGMLPLECLYLGSKALQSTAGPVAQPVKHFALKRKPKSAALRAELLQKSQEAASHPKKGTNFSTLPMKIRSFAKKMDDTTPLRGISSRTPGSGGFKTPNSRLSNFGATGNSINRTPGSKREGGVKLLDITEQPIGLKEAKRRRKLTDNEVFDAQKSNKEETISTPDYAAGLMAPATPRPPTVNDNATGTVGPSYVPASATRLPSALHGGPLPLPVAGLSVATQQARDNLQQHLNQSLSQQPIRAQTNSNPFPSQNNSQSQLTHPQPPSQITTNEAPPKEPPKKGLSLTREQMMEAQEMFKTSNKVTRPEKALILGFMAGSRDNPCPQNGPIVSIKLSEVVETLKLPSGEFKPMITDTYFVMNYDTGHWKRIKKHRETEN